MCNNPVTVYRYYGMDFVNFPCAGTYPRSKTNVTDEIMISDKLPFAVYCEKTEKFIETDFATVVEKDIIETARCKLVELIRKRQNNDVNNNDNN